ncbi:toll/interleukin-1 receptor domain-containing protein [Aquimarina aggregata]|uniref:toll/interleukin-1 receptor domain-containing protein n=1 Tax=Aquimarina aggregata TaxID=1642818 RepID=UPI00248F7609|nr:toll/interleukin-1 receptor domain-containing protein [Aquimarina aggregata]
MMNTNTLAQDISLYMFAKYDTNEIVKKMNQYHITISENILTKRQNLTTLLKQQEEHVLLKIQQGEKIGLPDSHIYHEINISEHVKPKKIFISHSEKDLIYVKELVNILEDVGIESNKIFCSSYEGYGNPLGSNYLEVLKEKLQGNTLVLFVFSPNFFNSKVGLCEMGATWILTQDQIPIYIPPFKAEDVKGVFPVTQGMEINNKARLIMLKERLEKEFNIKKTISYLRWNQKIDNSLDIINKALE